MSSEAPTAVELPISDPTGRAVGAIEIAVLPRSFGAEPPLLLDYRGLIADDPTLEPVQLLEGAEYRYEFKVGDSSSPVTTDRPELFDPESPSGLKGRLRPGLTVGTVPCCVRAGAVEIGCFAFEVRSRKLDYLTQYRWMLRDIADVAVEAIQERFGPAEQRFALKGEGDPRTLYQTFAFLSSFLTSELFLGAVHEVLTRPFVSWDPSEELVEPGRGLPPSSGLARQLVRPGPRRPVAGWDAITDLPVRVTSPRQTPTADNLPNRFVKHALKTWRDHAVLVQDALRKVATTTPVERGLREANALQAQLDDLLNHKVLSEVRDLDVLPLENQVLQKKSGYRELFNAYLKYHTAAVLDWDGADDVFHAGQRDVATLYEYWVFVQLSQLVAEFCGERLDAASLFAIGSSALTLRLKRGESSAVEGTVRSNNRLIHITLFFNRTFGARNGGTWSRPMRPDCSLRIVAEGTPEHHLPVWIHFDAKYRVDLITELFGSSPLGGVEEGSDLPVVEATDDQGRALRTDLLKMHAYRDAIRRSAGAYVIYPGTEEERCVEYHELLPGLGAFGLRPAQDGPALGTGALRSFISEVIDHVGRQTSQHERGRFWAHEVYERTQTSSADVPYAPFLRRPPSDTRTLLGYVRTRRQLSWIHSTHLYNLRADDRAGSVGVGTKDLGVELLLLYGPELDATELWALEGEPRLMTGQTLAEMGYRSPGGQLYMCLPIAAIDTGPWLLPRFREVLAVRSKLAPRATRFAPIVTTWLSLSAELAAVMRRRSANP